MTQENNTFTFGRPCGARMVIEADTADEMTQGGIHIPESARERPQLGTVLAVGKDITEGFIIGDRVLFGKNAGTPIHLNGHTFYVMHERDIFMHIDQEELANLIKDVTKDNVDNSMSSLGVKSDRSYYKVGDKIILQFKAEQSSKLTTSIFNGKKLVITNSSDISAGEIACPIIVTADMVPEISIELITKSAGENSYSNIFKKSTLKIEIAQ